MRWLSSGRWMSVKIGYKINILVLIKDIIDVKKWMSGKNKETLPQVFNYHLERWIHLANI